MNKKPWATYSALLLGLACLAAISAAMILQFRSLSAPINDTHQFLFLARTGVMIISVVTGVSAILMGFATFIVGAKGEFSVNVEHPTIKGAVNSGAPGLFFVLCGTVIVSAVVFSPFSYTESRSSPLEGLAAGAVGEMNAKSDSVIYSPMTEPATSIRAARSIASDSPPTFIDEDLAILPAHLAGRQEITGFFLRNEAAFEAALGIIAANPIGEDEVRRFVGTWMVHGSGIVQVIVPWDPDAGTLRSQFLSDPRSPVLKTNALEGFLIIPQDPDLIATIESLSDIRLFGEGGRHGIARVNWELVLTDLQSYFRNSYYFSRGRAVVPTTAD